MPTPFSFDWREENEAIHLDKHGIWFDFAVYVFLDPDRIEKEDDRKIHRPRRYNTVGMVDGICINVTFAMVRDVAWIISARPASRRRERRKYAT